MSLDLLIIQCKQNMDTYAKDRDSIHLQAAIQTYSILLEDDRIQERPEKKSAILIGRSLAHILNQNARKAKDDLKTAETVIGDGRSNNEPLLSVKGFIAYSTGNYDNAILAYSDALSISHSRQTFIERGKSYMSIGEFENAIEDFTNALTANVQDVMTRSQLGHLFITNMRNRGMKSKKENDLEDAEVYLMRGLAFEKMGHFSQAEQDYRFVIDEFAKANQKTASTYIDAYFRLASVFIKQGSQTYSDAKDMLDNLINHDSENLDYWKERIKVEALSRNWKLAYELTERYLQISPEDINAKLDLVEFTFKQGKYAEAADCMKQQVKSVKTPRAYMLLGVAMNRNNSRPSDILKKFRKAMDVYTDIKPKERAEDDDYAFCVAYTGFELLTEGKDLSPEDKKYFAGKTRVRKNLDQGDFPDFNFKTWFTTDYPEF